MRAFEGDCGLATEHGVSPLTSVARHACAPSAGPFTSASWAGGLSPQNAAAAEGMSRPAQSTGEFAGKRWASAPAHVVNALLSVARPLAAYRDPVQRSSGFHDEAAVSLAEVTRRPWGEASASRWNLGAGSPDVEFVSIRLTSVAWTSDSLGIRRGHQIHRKCELYTHRDSTQHRAGRMARLSTR